MLKKQKKTQDRTLFILTLVLACLGLIAVADASAPQALSVFSDKFYFVKQQLVWGAIGVFLLLIFSRVHYSFWEKVATPLFILSILFLILVLIPGIGTKTLGARRWIFFGPVSFQPSEFVKLTTAVYMAKVASKNKSFFSYIIPFFLVGGLIMLEPDLGTTMTISIAAITQIFVSGVSILNLLGTLLLGAAASILLILVSQYRRDRLMTFLSQGQDPLGKSYHIRQVLLALGSGGLFGVGLGLSRQKYLFLPEAATDSIFAIIAEELGFLGAAFIIILFALFVFQGLRIVRRSPDKFSYVLSSGLVAWIGGQAFLNIASMVAIVPLTGIPLPFFSYGGSALTMALLGAGILLNISRYSSA